MTCDHVDMHIEIPFDDLPMTELARYVTSDDMRWTICHMERQRFLARAAERAALTETTKAWAEAQTDGLIRERVDGYA